MGQETVQSTFMFAPKFNAKATLGSGVWTPNSSRTSLQQTKTDSIEGEEEQDTSTTTVVTAIPSPQPTQKNWTTQASPITTTNDRKEFRPVRFESPTLSRRYVLQQNPYNKVQPPWSCSLNHIQSCHPQSLPTPPRSANSCTNLSTPNTTVSTSSIYCDSSNQDSSSFDCCTHFPLPTNTTRSVSEKIRTFEKSASTSELYRPTRHRQLNASPAIYKPNEVIYNVKHEYMSEPEAEHDRPKKMTQLERRQYDGIGPVTNDGMPIILRSEVKAPHQHEWYKRLYQTIHKQKNSDDYVIRFKCPRGRYQNYKSNGYVSEPEPNYKSDYSTTKYRTLDRRNLQSSSSSTTNLKHPGNCVQDSDSYGTMPHPIKSGQNTYKNQPGRIEDYTTGYSSVSEKEKKEWYDEVMDIFNGHLEQTKLSPHYTEGNLSRALTKESGYTSDSNIVYRKKEVPLRNPLSPVEQKEAYKSLQAGGEPPLFGFRKPAPEKQREYPNRYFESDVNIHYKTPIRYEYKDSLSEEELAIRQAEQMQRLYQEERRRKYLQELQDMSSRRHTDNFIPSQKSPIALNRYDDFQSDLAKRSPNAINSSKTVARALYNFIGQTARELSFKKGDIIYIRRKIDKNWLEGEHNAMIGLLPSSYVEIISPDYRKQPPQKPSEGHARAKFNFQAQSNIELSLNKGELVTLTRRVDENWFEGKIANHKGIFPVSYVEVLSDIGSEEYKPSKTVITSSSITDLRPSLDTLRANINSEFNVITQNGHQAPNGILRETKDLHKTDVLHVDTSTEPIAYRSLYRYRPQNSDELELLEGDIVHVLEKCDDGWFVGTSQRTGCFGTFPGNYVERA